MGVRPRSHTFKPRDIPCLYQGCKTYFKTLGGRRRHVKIVHRVLGEGSQKTAPCAPVCSETTTPTPLPVPNDDFFDVHDDPTHPPISPTENSLPDDVPDNTGPQPPIERLVGGGYIKRHPYLDGVPCDKDGFELPKPAPPPPPQPDPADSFHPFTGRAQFELADFFYRKCQMSQGDLDTLMQLWAATGSPPPFADHTHLGELLDSIPVGDIPWQSFEVSYDGERPAGETPPWMNATYDVWFRDPREIARNQIKNPDFAREMDWAPKYVYTADGKREFCDFMSGNWAWRQADEIAKDSDTHGAMFCPIILGSDKTTVSVATGQNEYYPLYLSIGNVHNNVRRAHRNAVTLVGFLAIPKTEQDYKDDPRFRKFRRQLFHSSLAFILQSLRPAMTQPEITLCADGHYRRVIYGLGPYIADYPEQALLACIVQGWCPRCTAPSDDLDGSESIPRCHEHTEQLLQAFTLKELWDSYGIVGDLVPFTVGFPRADIHELLSPDLLHQVIKGTFKDHIVTWVHEWIAQKYGSKADAVLADIDRRIAAVPGFPGLRRFPQGRGFKQWTGDDSKALMKVYIPAIAGHVPAGIVRTLSALLEFCYLVRRDVVGEDDLARIESELERFHREREIFRAAGVRPDGFSLPRQHSLVHYPDGIREFGALNGLCSSITESTHIRAVKKPYRRSNHHNALGQMLLTNQRLDKLAAARTNFTSRGMLSGACVPLDSLNPTPQDRPPDDLNLEPSDPAASGGLHDAELGPVDGEDINAEVILSQSAVRHLPTRLDDLARSLGYPDLVLLTQQFLYAQRYPEMDLAVVPHSAYPSITGIVRVFSSAIAYFRAPSDQSGIGAMKREHIRSVPCWRGVSARRDCVFLDHDSSLPGMRGLLTARVLLFFSFSHEGQLYPCALVTWFMPIADDPCPDTGLWIVEPELDPSTGERIREVVHLDCMVRAAHLIGVAGEDFLPRTLRDHHSLDAFKAFYVNKYADHHAHTLAF